jgi:hypothetical protein
VIVTCRPEPHGRAAGDAMAECVWSLAGVGTPSHMTNSSSTENFTEPGADRAPTAEEATAAEQAAEQVDVDEVAENYEEAAERGANVKGEGEIEPH